MRYSKGFEKTATRWQGTANRSLIILYFLLTPSLVAIGISAPIASREPQYSSPEQRPNTELDPQNEAPSDATHTDNADDSEDGKDPWDEGVEPGGNTIHAEGEPINEREGKLLASCDHKIGLGTETRIEPLYPLGEIPSALCLSLATHETVLFDLSGTSDASSYLYNQAGSLLEYRETRGWPPRSRIVRTLPPGEYIFVVTSGPPAYQSHTLRTLRADESSGSLNNDLLQASTDDHGDHCSMATEADEQEASGHLGPQDVDVFSWWLSQDSDLGIELQGLASGQVEIKNEDCRSVALIPDLRRNPFDFVPELKAGRYFLYFSSPGGESGSYRLTWTTR